MSPNPQAAVPIVDGKGAQGTLPSTPDHQLPLNADIIALHDRTVPRILARAVALRPDQAALVEPLGRTLTYRELDREARGTAAGLRGLGLGAGDTVVAMLDPHADNIIGWLGANLASVVWVPINTSLKGSMLQFVLEHSEARVILIEATWVERIDEIASELTHLKTVVVRGGDGSQAATLDRFKVIDLDTLAQAEPVELEEPKVSDVSTIMYTSGTEGQSKGVLISHGAVYACSISHQRTAQTEITMAALPFFHAGGLFTGVFQAIRTAGTAVLHGTFSSGRYLNDLRTYKCTTALIVGPIAAFLLSQPPSAADRDHSLTNVVMFPVSPMADQFSERFGVPVVGAYGSTEVAAAMLSRPGEGRPGLCGQPVPHLEMELVDEFDAPVPLGEVGELVIRTREPYVLTMGYFKAPELTAKAFRNLWFHTGDLLRYDVESGQYAFVDRSKDLLRRRGENISSVEVERHLIALPGVREAAVVALKTEVEEDEVLAVIVTEPSADVRPEEVLQALYARLPYFMVPRYIDIVDELPKTQTMKVQKNVLRERGMTETVWDCEAAGYRVTRHSLVTPV